MVDGVLLLLLYVVGWALCTRLVYRIVADDMEPEDTIERAYAVTITILVSSFWPLVLVGFLGRKWIMGGRP